jgi:hypothetical protein
MIMVNMDETDMIILKTLSMSKASFNPVYSVFGDIGINENELEVRLRVLAKWGFVHFVKGSCAPGIILPNGIYSIGLTGLGRQLIISRQFTGQKKPNNPAI